MSNNPAGLFSPALEVSGISGYALSDEGIVPSLMFDDSSKIKHGSHGGHECLIAYSATGEVDGTW